MFGGSVDTHDRVYVFARRDQFDSIANESNYMGE